MIYFIVQGLDSGSIKDMGDSGKIGGPTTFYQCYDISEKISLKDNAVFYAEERCNYKEEPVKPELEFFTETEGGISINTKLALDKSCEKIIEKISGFELTGSGTQGIFLDTGSKAYYCGGLATS